MRSGAGAAALLLGVILIVSGSLTAARVGSALPASHRASTVAAGTTTAAVCAPAAAAGTGVEEWWRKHGQQVVEFAGCMLDGAGLARVLIAGISGVGGVLAAAGLVVGAIACLT